MPLQVTARGLCLATVALLLNLTAGARATARQLARDASGKEGVQVAVVNTYGWCIEVEAAVLYTFLSFPQVEVHSFNVFQENVETMDFLARVNPHVNYRPWEEIFSDPYIFDLVVVADWYPPGHPLANQNADRLMTTLLNQSFPGEVVVTLHEPRWLPWHPDDPAYHNFSDVVKDDRVHMFTISPHTAVIADSLAVAGVYKAVQWYAPVFPWRQLARTSSGDVCTNRTRGLFIVQGSLEPGRRSYARLFEGLLKKTEVIEGGDLQVRLIGRGELEIPQELAMSVKVISGLGQQGFYGAMLCGMAMLTLFPGDRYYTQAASSTVGTAISTGLPLIGPHALRHHYSYLQPDDVFLVGEDENDADCIEQVLGLAAADLQKHLDSIQRTLDALLVRNTDVFRGYLRRHAHFIDNI